MTGLHPSCSDQRGGWEQLRIGGIHGPAAVAPTAAVYPGPLAGCCLSAQSFHSSSRRQVERCTTPVGPDIKNALLRRSGRAGRGNRPGWCSGVPNVLGEPQPRPWLRTYADHWAGAPHSARGRRVRSRKRGCYDMSRSMLPCHKLVTGIPSFLQVRRVCGDGHGRGHAHHQALPWLQLHDHGAHRASSPFHAPAEPAGWGWGMARGSHQKRLACAWLGVVTLHPAHPRNAGAPHAIPNPRTLHECRCRSPSNGMR